jgi:hypothetical protein
MSSFYEENIINHCLMVPWDWVVFKLSIVYRGPVRVGVVLAIECLPASASTRLAWAQPHVHARYVPAVVNRPSLLAL